MQSTGREVHTAQQIKKEVQKKSRWQQLASKINYFFVGLSLAANMNISIDQQKSQQASNLFNPVSENSPVLSNLDVREFRKRLTLGQFNLLLNAEGKPGAYSFSPNFEIKELTDFQSERLEDAYQAALKSGMPEPAFVIRQTLVTGIGVPTPERPIITVAPDDLLTPEQLATFGITLVNPVSSESAPQVMIRESFFYGNNLLEPLRVLNDHSSEDEKTNVTLVNFNTEYLSQEYLLNLPEYANYKDSLKPSESSFEEYLTDMDNLLEMKIRGEKLFLSNKTDDTDPDVLISKKKLLEYKAERLIYLEALPHDEVINDLLVKQNVDGLPVGSYLFTDDGTTVDKNSKIFITAPEKVMKAPLNFYTIFVEPSGQFTITMTQYNSSMGLAAPSIDKSFPSPLDLSENENATFENDNYLYNFGDTVGFVSRHEMAHLLLVRVLPELAKKGIIHESEFAKSILEIPEIKYYLEQNGLTAENFPTIKSEYLTDIVAAKSIEIAHHRWVGSGLTDDTGYGIVFFIKGSPYTPEGYQLTEQHNKLPKQEDSL